MTTSPRPLPLLSQGPLVASRPFALPTRLALRGAGTGVHLIDGAWWPRSHQLDLELPLLLAALDSHWGRISRVTVDSASWAAGSGRLTVAARTVRINRSNSAVSRHTVCLLAYGVGRCDLLVVPPDTPAADAHALLTECSALPSGRPADSRLLTAQSLTTWPLAASPLAA